MTWIAVLGAVTGVLAALGWVIYYVVDFIRKPRLIISQGPYVQNWAFIGTTNIWRFVNFEVKSKRGLAQRCTAIATFIKYPNNVTHLLKEYALHWADVEFSGRTTGAEPIDIGIEQQRLDVVFTVPGHNGKSFITMPLALSAPGSVPQAELPQGEYVVKVTVYCANGRGDSRIIKLISPGNWKDLQAEEINIKES